VDEGVETAHRCRHGRARLENPLPERRGLPGLVQYLQEAVMIEPRTGSLLEKADIRLHLIRYVVHDVFFQALVEERHVYHEDRDVIESTRLTTSYHLITVVQMLLQATMKSGLGSPRTGLLPVRIDPMSVRAYEQRSIE